MKGNRDSPLFYMKTKKKACKQILKGFQISVSHVHNVDFFILQIRLFQNLIVFFKKVLHQFESYFIKQLNVNWQVQDSYAGSKYGSKHFCITNAIYTIYSLLILFKTLKSTYQCASQMQISLAEEWTTTFTDVSSVWLFLTEVFM